MADAILELTEHRGCHLGHTVPVSFRRSIRADRRRLWEVGKPVLLPFDKLRAGLVARWIFVWVVKNVKARIGVCCFYLTPALAGGARGRWLKWPGVR